MNKEALLELRKQINDSLLPLVLSADGDPQERADLLLGMIETGNHDEAVFKKAFEVVNAIEDPTQKSENLFRLLGEVESSLQGIDDAEQPQPEQNDQPEYHVEGS